MDLKRHMAGFYKSLIGGFLYHTSTLPNITYASSLDSRFMQNRSLIHSNTIKPLLRYLQGTKNYWILDKSYTNYKLFGYTDSDWAGSVDESKGTSRYAFILSSGIFSWASQK